MVANYWFRIRHSALKTAPRTHSNSPASYLTHPLPTHTQTLLGFNAKRRLLITGTPLQNDLMELWSLMHFLMPQVFGESSRSLELPSRKQPTDRPIAHRHLPEIEIAGSHAQFRDWFSNPLTGMAEGSAEHSQAVVGRLHAVLRPFLLRRLKRDVEKQLPGKVEHVVRCRLSKRQRQLYEEYMASGEARAALSSGSFVGVFNVLMQLRKVRFCCLLFNIIFIIHHLFLLLFTLHAHSLSTNPRPPATHHPTTAGLQPPGPLRGPPDRLRL